MRSHLHIYILSNVAIEIFRNGMRWRRHLVKLPCWIGYVCLWSCKNLYRIPEFILLLSGGYVLYVVKQSRTQSHCSTYQPVNKSGCYFGYLAIMALFFNQSLSLTQLLWFWPAMIISSWSKHYIVILFKFSTFPFIVHFPIISYQIRLLWVSVTNLVLCNYFFL